MIEYINKKIDHGYKIMGITRELAVNCSCGYRFSHATTHSVNVDRFPKQRKDILDRTFHKTHCPSCKMSLCIDIPLVYFDKERHTLIAVGKEQDHYRVEQFSELLKISEKDIPSFLNLYNLRVVFGLEELREKLIAQDAEIDDRLIEGLKILILYEHPFLLNKSRLRLHLESVDTTNLIFHASFGHSDGKFSIRLPKSFAQSDTAIKLRHLDEKIHKSAGIFNPSNLWNGLRRLSPQTKALSYLDEISKSIEQENDVDLDGEKLTTIILYAPRGQHLPSWAKRALRIIQAYARKHNRSDIEQKIFELRFDIILEDEWAYNNNPTDIPTLWDLLKKLPETDVEGNTSIERIDLIEGSGGYYESNGTISIGSELLHYEEDFANTVRHEIAHGVHEKSYAEITNWLESRFGWKEFDLSDTGINQWVELMGGWGEVDTLTQNEVRSFLREAVGNGGSWNQVPVQGPFRHIWNSSSFGPGEAARRTTTSWYENHRLWWRFGGNAFFLNYWYASLMVVSEEALNMVEIMPSNYAVMSPAEFYAELYALYYNSNDPNRENLPADLLDWFSNHA